MTRHGIIGRPISPLRKPRYCPACGGTMVKAGNDSLGKQRWRCRLCKHTTPWPSREPIT